MEMMSQKYAGILLAIVFTIGLLLVHVVNGAKMYWTDERGIHRADLDGRNVQTIVPVAITSVSSMAIDEVGEKIYYADRIGSRILRSDLDGANLESVITSGLHFPSSLVLDSDSGKIYWMDDFKIYRANLDGTDVEMLIDSWEIYNLAIDPKAGKLYWFRQLTKYDRTIMRANLDGTGCEAVIQWNINEFTPGFVHPGAIAIDSKWRKIYLTNFDFIAQRSAIQRANMNGSDIEVVLEGDFSWPGSIAVDAKSGKVFWADSKTERLRRANLDGSDVETIATKTKVGYITLAPVGEKIYWTNLANDTVHRANLDGSRPETIRNGEPREFFGIDVDERRGKIYWTNWTKRWPDGGEIYRANLDGSAAELLITKGLKEPSGIAVDAVGGKIYWVDGIENKVVRANLDGADVEDLVIHGMGKLLNIEVDSEAGKMYWIDVFYGSPKIHRANLDGTEVEDFMVGLADAYGIAIDEIVQKVYWTDQNKIQSASLDGTNVAILVRAPDRFGWWHDVTVDGIERKMYWVDRRKGLIQRANLDGTGVETVVSDLATPKHIALNLTPADVVAVEAQGKQFVSWGHIRQNVLLQNYPNPFNPETWIPFRLAYDADVTVQIYNLHGQPIRRLSLGYLSSGSYEARNRAAYWDGKSDTGEVVPSGVYFYKIQAGDYAAVRRMAVVK